MTIPPGTRLGPFDIAGVIGAGAMGTVYRAYDPRLRREVAIKVLPPPFAADAERLRRFEQEALAVARLAHPNIVAVYDIGSHDGTPYIVTELLEGETLRATMAGRPIGSRRAAGYAAQIARGLAAAHERGVVHRDIKPENLFVTRDGRIKILDFGLARLTSPDEAAAPTADTLTAHGLGPLGTAAYMSPEQSRGARPDHRSDLFSLGIVLYEMLSGVSPFRRETPVETMTAILRDDAPEIPEAAGCPAALRTVLHHCLEKDPAHRFQSAADLAFALEALSDAGIVKGVHAVRRFWHRPAFAVGTLAAVALIAGAAGFAVARRDGSPPRDGLAGIHRLTDFNGIEESPAIAPDLKSVAFTGRVAGVRQVFVRLLAGGTPLQITRDAVDHDQPRWSRDSSALFYFSPAAEGDVQGTIWETPALGGAPRRVIDSIGSADVARDGRIACFRLAGRQTELVSASPDGTGVRVIARFAEPVYYKYPRWSPDATWIAYQRGDGVRWDVFAVPSTGGSPRQITHDNGQIHGLSWLPDGTGLVYSSSRGTTMPYLPTLGLWEQRLEGGEPRRLAPAEASYLQPDVHESGAIVATRLQIQFDLWRYPVDGTPRDNVRHAMRLTHQTGQVQTPTVGMSDREVAFLSDSGGHANLWVVSAETGELREITHERDGRVSLGVPIWSPDGKWIAFVSSRGNTGLGFSMWTVNPDGGHLQNVAARGLGASWSPDGQWLYYIDAGTVYKVRAGGGPAARVRTGPVRNVAGVDGQTLYFVIDRTLSDGRPGFEIHTATPEGAPSRVLAHIPSSRAPQWQIINPALSRDGQWLATPLTDGATTNIWALSTSNGQWRQVTDFDDRPVFIARRVSWSPDGRSIFAAVGEGDADIVIFEGSTSPRNNE